MSSNRRPHSLAASRGLLRLSWLLAALALLAAGAASVRPAAAQSAPESKILSGDELADVVGPIALYPDDLIGIVLPASTYPLQIVEAARFLDKRKQDPSLKPSEDWDDSVVALLNYPEVVQLLNDDLDWTWDLGTAVLNQRGDVLDAIQTFRERARAAGNLRTDNHQTVTEQTDGAITIAPADPQVIYVPYYEPERVVVYQTRPVFDYYPWAYPVYYYPYPAGYAFDTGLFWGVTSFFSIGWHSHLLYIHHYGYRDHPYYGSTYYRPYYARNYFNVNVNVGSADHVWHPRSGYGARPLVRGRDGYVADGHREPHVSHGVASSASRSYRDGGSSYRDGASSTRPSVTTAPRTGGGVGAVAGTEHRTSPVSRPPSATADRGVRTSPTSRPPGATADGNVSTTRKGTAPARQGSSYRVGGGMARASEQSRSQRLVSVPPSVSPPRTAPATRNGAAAAPRYRAPAAPTQRSQIHTASPSASYRAAARPEVHVAAPAARVESHAAVRAAPRGGGSYRSSGGSSSRGGGHSSQGGRSSHSSSRR
jgi:Protein of unknown function (DUF3300)